MQNILERRLKLLEMEGKGFNQPEVVKALSEKYLCSPRMIYRDFQTRAKWQPRLTQSPERMVQKIINRFDQIYRQAAFILITTQNESVKLGALARMTEANSKLMEVTILTEIVGDIQLIKTRVGVKP